MEYNKNRLYSDRHIRRLVEKKTNSDLQRIFNETISEREPCLRQVCNDSEKINVAQREIICPPQDLTQLISNPLEDNSVDANMYNDEYRYPSSRDNTFSSEDEQSEILDKCNNKSKGSLYFIFLIIFK